MELSRLRICLGDKTKELNKENLIEMFEESIEEAKKRKLNISIDVNTALLILHLLKKRPG